MGPFSWSSLWRKWECLDTATAAGQLGLEVEIGLVVAKLESLAGLVAKTFG
jgi:hypothetical protein